MNKKEFKRAMMSGLGRCYLALQTEEREKFREIVQWGCLHNLAYDTQSDGTAHEYMYRLVRCYEDPASFLPPVIETFAKIKRVGYRYDDWYIVHLCRLLTLFAKDGYQEAKRALTEKYEAFLRLLSDPDRVVEWYVDYDEEIFTELGVCLLEIDGKKAYVRIAEDLDGLVREANIHCEDLPWLIQDIDDRSDFVSYVERNASGAKAFLDDYARYKRGEWYGDESDEEEEEPASEVPTIKNEKSEGEKEAPPEERSDEWLVSAPLDKITKYLDDADRLTADSAREAFTQREDEATYRYAKLRLAFNGPEWWTMIFLLRHYRPENEALLLGALKEMKFDFADTSGWHAVVLEITGEYSDRKVDLPASVLREAYTRSLCKHCRYRLFTQLYERGALADLEQEEAYFDAEEDIVRFAKEHDLKKPI